MTDYNVEVRGYERELFIDGIPTGVFIKYTPKMVKFINSKRATLSQARIEKGIAEGIRDFCRKHFNISEDDTIRISGRI